MHKKQYELNEAKENFSKSQKDNEEMKNYHIKKGYEFTKMKYVNEALKNFKN
jgi:hypothetical protein